MAESYEVTQGIRHHTKAQCGDEPCPFHKPSLHPMIEEPMLLRTDPFKFPLIERVCRHGVGHPDPDSVAFLELHGKQAMGMHGCDGCCRLPGGSKSHD